MILYFIACCFSQHTRKPSVFFHHSRRADPHKPSSCQNRLEVWLSAQSSSLAAAAGLLEVASIVRSLTRKASVKNDSR